MVDLTKPLVVALILFSIFSALQVIDDDNLNEMFSNVVVQNESIDVLALNTAGKAGYFILYSQSLNNIVPTFRYELPFYDRYIVGINDIPFPDTTDLFIVIPLMILPIWIFKGLWKKNKDLWTKLGLVLAIILIALISWLIAKHLYYQLYLYSAEQIGLTQELAVSIRDGFISNTEESKLVLGIISIFGMAAVLFELNKKE